MFKYNWCLLKKKISFAFVKIQRKNLMLFYNENMLYVNKGTLFTEAPRNKRKIKAKAKFMS